MTDAPAIRRRLFGRTVGHAMQEPRDVEAVTLDSGDGIAATVLTYGSHLVSVLVPDRAGHRDDVVVSLPDLAAYEDRGANPYLGAVVGRYANRIGGATFVLDGHRYELAPNEGPNLLHGGPIGFDRHVWKVDDVGAVDGGLELWLTLRSPDGDQGFPGAVSVTARWRLETDRLLLAMDAVTDSPTVVSLTNHAYWNLAGTRDGSAPPVLDHRLTVAAGRVVAVDDALVPTGELAAVDGTRLDLRTPQRLADVLPPAGFDHCLVLDGRDPAAVLTDPSSGRCLTLVTDQAGLQLYVPGGPAASPRSVCLEAQHLPDAPNQPAFPSPVLRPGEVYRHTTTHVFTTT